MDPHELPTNPDSDDMTTQTRADSNGTPVDRTEVLRTDHAADDATAEHFAVHQSQKTIEDLPPTPPIGPPADGVEVGFVTPTGTNDPGQAGPPPVPSHPSPSRWWWLGGVLLVVVLLALGAAFWPLGGDEEPTAVGDGPAAADGFGADPEPPLRNEGNELGEIDPNPDLGLPGDRSFSFRGDIEQLPDLEDFFGPDGLLEGFPEEFFGPDGLLEGFPEEFFGPDGLPEGFPEEFFGPDGLIPRSGDGTFSFRFGPDGDPLEFEFTGELPETLRDLLRMVPGLLAGEPTDEELAAAAELIDELLADESLNPRFESFVRDLAERLGIAPS